jgi:DNA-binding XRE family transcriptional regulator
MKTVGTNTEILWKQSGENIANYAILLRGPYSQKELAAVLHVKQQSISDWEAGRVRPMAKQLRALLSHFLDWYETQRLEYAATLALTLLPKRKPLTPQTTHAKPRPKRKSSTPSPQTLRRT